MQRRSDLLTKDERLLLIRNKQKNDFSPCSSLRNRHHRETVSPGRIPISILAIADDNLANTTVAQILRLCRTLIAIAEKSHALSLHKGEIGISIIVDSCTHRLSVLQVFKLFQNTLTTLYVPEEEKRKRRPRAGKPGEAIHSEKLDKHPGRQDCTSPTLPGSGTRYSVPKSLNISSTP